MVKAINEKALNGGRRANLAVTGSAPPGRLKTHIFKFRELVRRATP